jgi:hypothetical protein
MLDDRIEGRILWAFRFLDRLIHASMKNDIPLKGLENLSLKTAVPVSDVYPSSRIAKGLVLAWEDEDLSAEGVGFGLPVFKFEKETVFPGSCRWRVRREREIAVVEAGYELNLTGRLMKGGKRIDRQIVYRVREYLSSVHRKHPKLRRRFMSASEALRRRFLLEDIFEEIPSAGLVELIYRVEGCSIHVGLQAQKSEGCPAVVFMNEQGASYFDAYRDSDGLCLEGSAIGSWDEIRAQEASFLNRKHRIAFTLGKTGGTRMFRGREWTARRLNWAGIACLLPPGTERFEYSIQLSRI